MGTLELPPGCPPPGLLGTATVATLLAPGGRCAPRHTLQSAALPSCRHPAQKRVFVLCGLGPGARPVLSMAAL